MKKTLSVFIPAHNEEKNIKKLLNQIIDQHDETFILEKILVISDASTDNTEKEVCSVYNPKIELVINSERKGKWFGFTIAQKKLTSDIIVSLDADITISTSTLFTKLTKTLQQAEITSPEIVPHLPNTLFEKISATGWSIGQMLYKKNLPKTEIMLCHGRCLATTNKLFREIIWQPTFGTDAFMYLFAKKHNYTFLQTPSYILFHLPTSIQDFSLQSNRALLVRDKMRLFFDDFSEKIYNKIRWYYYLFPIFWSLCKHPLLTFGYVFVRIKSSHKTQEENPTLWNTASSTK